MQWRWRVFLVNLDPVIGSEQGRTRPALVISEDEVNRALPVVSVLPITSRKSGRNLYPNEVLLPAGMAGLDRDSIVLCHQIRTVDRQRLVRRLGTLSDTNLQEQIVEALCFQLGIAI